MEANITISGNVGGEVDYRAVSDQAAVSTFRLACTPRLVRNGTWTDGTTTWVSVQCWRQLAANVAHSVHKGDPVIVTGRLRTNRWRGEDGTEHERLIIEATRIGHDLTRGTTQFTKTERAPVEADRDELGVQSLTEVERQRQESDESELVTSG